MAKKRKDLSGQLDGLFADFDAEEEAEAQEKQVEPALAPPDSVEEPQVIDELVAGGPPEPSEQAEMPGEAPAIDALLAAEPSIIEASEEGQARPAVAEPAIDALLAAEPVELPEEVSPVEEALSVEEQVKPVLAEPDEVPAPAAVEKVEAEPEPLEAVEFRVVEAVEPGPAVVEPLAVEEAPEAPVAEAPVGAELPTMAELLAVEEAVPAVSAEVVPEIPEPVAAEVVVEPEPVGVAVEREAVEPVPPSAPPDWEATIREQRTRILNRLLLLIFGAATLVVASLVAFSYDDPEKWLDYLPYFGAWVVLLIITFARRLNPIWRTVGLVVLAYAVGVVNLYLDGPLGAGWLYLLLAPLLLSTLVGRQAGIYAALGSFGVYLIFSVIYYAWEMEPLVDTLLREEWTWTTVLLNMSGTFGLILAAATMIQWMFNSSLTTFLREAEGKHAEVVRSQEVLRERAEELTAANVALRERSLQLETASQVSQAASSELDSGELMQQVVDLICERFDLYYVGLFLVGEAGAGNGADATQHKMLLRAGTGVAGRWMLTQGYSVEIGDDSIVGQCAARGQAQTMVHMSGAGGGSAGDLLPQTRSEIALPLRSRGRVLGALDVHSIKSEAFSRETIAVLQTMADQIAVTIDNAHLFAELRQRLQEMEASQRLYVREQWTDLAPRRISPFYERARPDAAPLTDAALSEVEEVALRREMVAKLGGDGGTSEAALVTPISLRGQIIGALGLQEVEGRQQWTEDEIALIEAVTDQMALAIENVRLLEETRQLAGWEQTLSDITARFSRSLDTETLLQTAIQELGDLLQVDEVSVHIGSPAEFASVGDEETA
jgi:GAF domain-containing protein